LRSEVAFAKFYEDPDNRHIRLAIEQLKNFPAEATRRDRVLKYEYPAPPPPADSTATYVDVNTGEDYAEKVEQAIAQQREKFLRLIGDGLNVGKAWSLAEAATQASKTIKVHERKIGKRVTEEPRRYHEHPFTPTRPYGGKQLGCALAGGAQSP
jgi:hypothetical protein